MAEVIKSLAAERRRRKTEHTTKTAANKLQQKAPIKNKHATTTMVKQLTPGGPKQALKVSDSDSARRGVHLAQKIGPGDAYRPSCGKLRFCLEKSNTIVIETDKFGLRASICAFSHKNSS